MVSWKKEPFFPSLLFHLLFSTLFFDDGANLEMDHLRWIVDVPRTYVGCNIGFVGALNEAALGCLSRVPSCPFVPSVPSAFPGKSTRSICLHLS